MGKFRAVITDTTAKKVVGNSSKYPLFDTPQGSSTFGYSNIIGHYKGIPYSAPVRDTKAATRKTILDQLKANLNKAHARDIHFEENGKSVIVTAAIPDAPGVY